MDKDDPFYRNSQSAPPKEAAAAAQPSRTRPAWRRYAPWIASIALIVAVAGRSRSMRG